ncbi:glycosyltransferase [Azovibrio restrictus]|uniref:glycosyltransferase n=1 Tax=Azovibrio restrictus TaxID=146938 RepID=UPI0026EE2E4B|nr:glycosyltransferase [Azovibrio restrictus]
MSEKPAISVVLPVYNAEAYVREAVESILAQTFTDFELIIINDGSTDASGSILRELAAHDPRIVLVERANAGLVSALNEGIGRARADFIARMDADDVAIPERFALQLARMSAEPGLGVLGSFIRIVDKTGRFIRLGTYPVAPAETARFLEHGSPLAHPTVMMRKEAVIKAGGYRKVFSHCEDYDLWLRISELGYAIANLPQPLLNYRVHGANVSTVHREAQELGTIVARLAHRCRKAGLPDPVEGVEKIQAELIQTVPASLRQDLEAAMFVLRHARVSLADRSAIESAWQDYQNLHPEAQRESVTCGFLMRLLNGAVRNQAYALAMRVLIEAYRLHPLDSSKLLCIKFKARLSL